MKRTAKVLIISNTSDATSDYLIDKLNHTGIQFFRIDTDLIDASVKISINQEYGCILFKDELLYSSEIKKIIIRRPTPIKISLKDEAHSVHIQNETTTAIEGVFSFVDIKNWINHPSANVRASNKPFQLICAKRLGLKVPKWIVSSIEPDLIKFYKKYPKGTIVKPLHSGIINRFSSESTNIFTNELTSVTCLKDSILPPLIIQEKVEKGVDVRITVVGKEMIAVSLQTKNPHIDIRYNNMKSVVYKKIQIPQMIKNKIRDFMDLFSLNFGAFDFIVDKNGEWIFIELNPNGQWAWMDPEVDNAISDLFIQFLID